MDHDRRHVLAGLALLIGVVSAYFLREVIATVFFAGTVAYLLAPVQEWAERRGLSSWWASVVATLVGTLGIVAVLSPLLIVVYVRSDAMFELIDVIPRELTISQLGFETTITVKDAIPVVKDFLREVVLSAASVAPTLAIKATVFAIVVFALLIGRDDAHDAVRAVVPLEYHDVLASMAGRARDTLVAIYVLQAATAAVAFSVALPLFMVLGYDYPFTLATIAGVLQFVPIVGPSVLVVAMAGFEFVTNQPQQALVVGVLGFALLAYLPDPLVRPRLARRTADLPGSLYFVGFTGGLFTLGVVGVIAGPLLVALLVESVELLADEMDDHREDEDPDGEASDDTDEVDPASTEAPDTDPSENIDPDVASE